MVISSCDHYETRKNGKDHLGNPRVRCCLCGKSWIDRSNRPLGDMRIEKDKAVMALRMMLEGSSLRTINRLTGLNRHTLANLLLTVGERCQKYFDSKIVNVPARDIQCDELWAFIGAKEKTARLLHKDEQFGDCYTFLAIDRDSKLILTYKSGKRSLWSTQQFVSKLRVAIQGDCQITTDGFAPYTQAIPTALWDKNITFAQLIKIFGKQQAREEARYSPAPITGIIKKRIWGETDEDKISTSHIERFNRSLRMGLRRFTRLTDGHSKSLKHHEAAIALFLMFYNFCRPHMTLKTTPAVSAKLTSETWTIERLLNELASCENC